MAKRNDSRLSADERRIGDLDEAARIRRERMHAAPINERLSRLNALCRQISGVRVQAPPDR